MAQSVKVKKEIKYDFEGPAEGQPVERRKNEKYFIQLGG